MVGSRRQTRNPQELNEKHLEVKAKALAELRDRLRECLSEGNFNLIRGVLDPQPATDPEESN